jgi:hypothetical protein
MNARYIARRVAKIVAAHGETITLKREGETDLALKGKRIGGNVDDIGGTAAQQSFRVRIAPTELAASVWAVKEPKRKDALVVGGRTRLVTDVRPISDGDTVAMYELEVAG